MKMHSLKRAVIDYNEFQFFYTRERNDKNGNPHYKVFIIDPDAPTAYETIFKCCEFQIAERVKDFILDKIGIALPF